MAVLNKIRQRSVFLIAIIALALFAFVLADVLKNGGFSTQKSQRVIGSVNGEDIDQQEFASLVETQTARYGNNISNTQAVNAAWEEELRRILLTEQFEELGISIEQDRISDLLKNALQNDPNFQNADGVYSVQKVREYIATLKATNPTMYDQWVAYEKQLAKNEQQQIYFDLIKAGINTSFKEGQMAYEMENNLRDIEFVQVPYTSIADDQVSVTKDDIESYIKNHKDEYQTEATRNLRYVLFSEDATLTDEDAIKASTAELLNNRQVYTAATKTNDTVRGLSTTTNPEDFVNENSDIRYTDMFLFKSELPAEVSNELWALNEGDTFGPYKDNGYFKISKVEAVTQIPDSVQSSHILLTYQGLQNAAARSYYQKAVASQPSMGIVYLRIAAMYASSANNCGDSVFNKRAIYWLAADTAAKAGRIDPSLSDVANKTAASYRALAPDRTMIFNAGNAGQRISFNCWVGGSVTVPNL